MEREKGIAQELRQALESYIAAHYVPAAEKRPAPVGSASMPHLFASRKAASRPPREAAPQLDSMVFGSAAPAAVAAEESADELAKRIARRDESFQQMLLRLIDDSGLTDAQCYKKAGLDRKLFSKIRGDVHYRPSKRTAVALALALELDMARTKELLEKAGFALSRSSVFDIIITYFVERGEYDLFTVNEALYAFDQPTLF